VLSYPIQYKNYNDETVSEVLYFNLSKPELLKLEVDMPGGLVAYLEKIIKTEDRKALVEQFDRIILMSYGVKSDDGKRFIKNDDVAEAFKQSAAYEQLFMEITNNANAAAAFVSGILPKDLTPEQDKPNPPVPPTRSDA